MEKFKQDTQQCASKTIRKQDIQSKLEYFELVLTTYKILITKTPMIIVRKNAALSLSEPLNPLYLTVFVE